MKESTESPGSADPTPVLIGYEAKKVEKRPDWLKSAGVEEICSVSHCISRGPPGWHEYKPERNRMWLYRSDADAIASIPPEDASSYDIFAYKLSPRIFGDEGEVLDFDAEESAAFLDAISNVSEMSQDYEFLGYDCPNKQVDWPYGGFDCSRLSCNRRAEQIPVNRYCLLDGYDNAVAVQREFCMDQQEQWVHYLIEVWRKRRGDANP